MSIVSFAKRVLGLPLPVPAPLPPLAAAAGPGCLPSCTSCALLSGRPSASRRALVARVVEVVDFFSERRPWLDPDLPPGVSPELQHAVALYAASSSWVDPQVARRALALPDLSGRDLALLLTRVLATEGLQFMPDGRRFVSSETLRWLTSVRSPVRLELARVLLHVYADPDVWDHRSLDSPAKQLAPLGSPLLDTLAAALVVSRVRGGDTRAVLAGLEVESDAVREVFRSLAQDASDGFKEDGLSPLEVFETARMVAVPVSV